MLLVLQLPHLYCEKKKKNQKRKKKTLNSKKTPNKWKVSQRNRTPWWTYLSSGQGDTNIARTMRIFMGVWKSMWSWDTENQHFFIRLSHPIDQTTIKYCIWMFLVILCGFFCFFVSGWTLSYLILEKGERKITCFYSRSYWHIGISSCIAESFVSDRYNYIEDVRLHR